MMLLGHIELNPSHAYNGKFCAKYIKVTWAVITTMTTDALIPGIAHVRCKPLISYEENLHLPWIQRN